uniref:CAAX prenyl protease 2/Lysostaphin resistance protein A-like domain-containing protein n=1 Tax=Pseudo-nitzschia delicatissima TaxID=44447 RepID=A0A7S0TC87_9STRA|mmetsp:Transcript_593/g.1327  ORF Transcript_593/g.1327 Transcript_593/m.1327 type:complete len:444 (+) Transcript_593:171-1502(+)
MPNQNQPRFCLWTICFVILGGYESLALSTSKCRLRISYSSAVQISSRGPSILHSTNPLYYQETCEEPVPKQPSVVANRRITAQSPTDSTQAASISLPVINYICTNQALLLLFASSAAIAVSFFSNNPFEISSLHWNGAQDFHSLFDWQPSFSRVVTGLFASIPVIATGRFIETSDNRDASRVNFATTNMVISLFGRRKSALEPTASASLQVMVLSALIAVSSGISEEIIFRGYIPTAIFAMTNSLSSALFGQAVLYASGHLSKDAEPGENMLNWSQQLFNGLWYASVYQMSGGDILPCIISHVLYDMHTLCQTWTEVNDQMDYTQKSSKNRMEEEEQTAVQRVQRGTGITLNPETVDFARHFFYAFDNDHAGNLSLSDCQRAVSYAFMNDSTAPDSNVVRDLFEQAKEQRYANGNWEPSDRLDFSEFLHLLVALRSNSRQFSR